MALGTTGISTTLVANTIGVGSNDVGTLCTSSKINKWSKWKPLIQPVINTDSLTNWWKGTDGKCGFTYDTITSLNDISTADWHYHVPTGGASAPFRLGDFRNYEHSAICAWNGKFNTQSVDISLYTYTGGSVYELELDHEILKDDPYILGVKDLLEHTTSGTEYASTTFAYFGAYKKSTDSTWNEVIGKLGSSDATLANIFVNTDGTVRPKISFPVGSFNTGTYNACVYMKCPGYNVAANTTIPFPKDAGYTSFNINISNTIPYVVDVTKISSTLNGTYYPVANYRPINSTYLQLVESYGDIYLECTITVNATGLYSPLASDLAYKNDILSSSSGDTVNTTYLNLSGNLYNSSKVAITSLPIHDLPVGGTFTFILHARTNPNHVSGSNIMFGTSVGLYYMYSPTNLVSFGGSSTIGVKIL